MPIRAITIVLFAVGIFIAAVLAYQQFAAANLGAAPRPYAISKDRAIDIALDHVDREPNRDSAFLPDRQATAKLVHVTGDGLAFVADEDSLADMWLYSKDRTSAQSGYFWHVDVTTSNADSYRGYYYLVNASSGEIVGNDRDPDFSTAP